eukprot:7128941-Alexandrium_andersonii.AAC.1
MAARAERIRFAGCWHAWGFRPISECLARTGKRPAGSRWVDQNKGTRRSRTSAAATWPRTPPLIRTIPRSRPPPR